MLKALPLVHFWSVLLVKEQMPTSVRKTLKTLVWSAQNRLISREICLENNHKIGCFLPIAVWWSLFWKLSRNYCEIGQFFLEFVPKNPMKFDFFFHNLSEALNKTQPQPHKRFKAWTRLHVRPCSLQVKIKLGLKFFKLDYSQFPLFPSPYSSIIKARRQRKLNINPNLILMCNIQLFWERSSEKVHGTIPKGIVGGFVCPVLQRSLKEWHARPRTYVRNC